MSLEQGLLVMESASEQDGGSVIVGGLGAAAQLLQTAASLTRGSDTLLHILICDERPATSLTPQPGCSWGNFGLTVKSPASVRGLFLTQRAGTPLVYGEGHLGWVQLH